MVSRLNTLLSFFLPSDSSVLGHSVLGSSWSISGNQPANFGYRIGHKSGTEAKLSDYMSNGLDRQPTKNPMESWGLMRILVVAMGGLEHYEGVFDEKHAKA